MKKFIPVACILFLVFACGDDSSGPAGSNRNYLPIAVGNYWNFDIEGDGLLNSFEITVGGDASFEVTGTEIHDSGFDVYELDSEMEMIIYLTGVPIDTTTEVTTQYLHVTDDEINRYESLSDTTAYLCYELPIETGNVWYPGSDDPTGRFEVLSLTASAIVPFGNYSNCAEIEYTNSTTPDGYERQYLAQDIGPVMVDIYMYTDSTNYLDFEYNLTQTNL